MTASALSSCGGSGAFNCARIHAGELAAMPEGTWSMQQRVPTTSRLKGLPMLAGRRTGDVGENRLFLIRRSDLLEELLQCAVVIDVDDSQVQSKRTLPVHRSVRVLIGGRVAETLFRDVRSLREAANFPVFGDFDGHIVIHLIGE